MGIHDKYSLEVHEFVKKWSPKLRDEDLAEACNKELGTNFTASKMKSFRSNHKYYNGMKQWNKEEYWKYQKKYPQGMYEFIRDNSWGVGSKEMAEMVYEKFGYKFTTSGMKQFRQRHGIKSGVTGWYQKGRDPGNKGKKQSDYMSPEAIERTKATRFQPGSIPHNTKPIGTISVIDGYKYIKISDKGRRWDMWKSLHQYVWEQHNGPVPEGMILTFKDQDPLNCDIDNLMIITRTEHCAMTRKHLRSKNPEITEAGLNLVRLEETIRDRKKKGKANE